MRKHNHAGRAVARLCLVTVLPFALCSCAPLWGVNALPSPVVIPYSGTATFTPFQPEGYLPPPTETETPLAVEPTQTLTPTPTALTQVLWISPAVPMPLRQAAQASNLPLAAAPESATLHLDIYNPQSAINNDPSSIWIYALVTPYPTTTDGVTLADLQNAWAGAPSGPFTGRPLWMDETTLAAFSAQWGAPASGSVSVAAPDQLLDSAWAAQPAWAILPFENLEPRWKVLAVDGHSPVHNDFDASAYPLKIAFSLQSSAISLPPTNRDPARLTVLAMTGVTALVRGTADQMEKNGVLYPGEEVRSVLLTADLTHVSNEISFREGCPVPNPWTESLQFCSDPKYIALLDDVGVDIVELTGNHLLDYSPDDLLMTLDMYDQRGWKYFGGGRNLEASFQPALVEDHGNRLAFLGCNYTGPQRDFATDDQPGSTPCDFDRLEGEITELRSQGYLPIVTFQYFEYYQSAAAMQEQIDFRRMADAGAIIVSGSQSHVPAAMEFYGGTFIHYGLGNLFFDQMSHLMPDNSIIYDTRNVFIDRHIFYAGRYLGNEMLTYIIENYARPRLMTDAERQQFLQSIFSAAGW